MVDFDNETTIGTPSTDIIRIILLQYRYDTRDAFEKYMKDIQAGVEGNISIVKARLITWFLEMRAMLKRRNKKGEYSKLYKQVMAVESEKEVIDVICILDDILDSIHLTRVDTRIKYDSSRVEKENRVKNL